MITPHHRITSLPLQRRILPSALPGLKENPPLPGDADTVSCDPAPAQPDRVTAGEPEPRKKKWTILVYSAADNNLLTYMFMDINEMEAVGSNEDTSIAVQFDEGRRGARRFLLQKDKDPGSITSPVLAEMGAINMADPAVLSDFITWGVRKWPADHYALIISDHGAGWQGAIEDSSHEDWMKLPAIRRALDTAQAETGVKLDVIGFDACLMGAAEVAYELRKNADYMVASEESEGAAGWPYAKVLSGSFLKSLQERLRSKLTMTAEDFAKKIVDDSGSTAGALPTMAAIDLSKMDRLAGAANRLAGAMLKPGIDTVFINNQASRSETFYVFKDQYDFCERLVKDDYIKDEELKQAAREVMDVIKNEAVIRERHSDKHPNAHGLHIELHRWGNYPGESENWPTYKELAFAKDTKWDEALNKLAGREPSPPRTGAA